MFICLLLDPNHCYRIRSNFMTNLKLTIHHLSIYIYNYLPKPTPILDE